MGQPMNTSDVPVGQTPEAASGASCITHDQNLAGSSEVPWLPIRPPALQTRQGLGAADPGNECGAQMLPTLAQVCFESELKVSGL